MITVIDELEYKLAQLLECYEFLKDENDFLHSKVMQLNHQNESQKVAFQEMKGKFQNLKVAKTIGGSEENKTQTRRKINSLIKEIDKCIVQLSS